MKNTVLYSFFVSFLAIGLLFSIFNTLNAQTIDSSQKTNLPSVLVANQISYTENGFTFDLNDANYTATITDYDGVVKDVVIPETVQFNGDTYIVDTIGDQAFNNKALTSVVFTNNITTIGVGAFGLNSIQTIYLPDSVTSINESSFGSNLISNLRLSSNMTIIPKNAFANNSSLETVEIPNGIIRIESGAFLNCRISDLVIPDSVTYIGDVAFYSNRLRSLKLSSNLETIGDQAFSSSTHSFYNQLTSVVIPDSVKTIGFQAFMYNRINTIVMSGNITSIDYQALFQYPDVSSIRMFINDIANTDQVISQVKSNTLSPTLRDISLFAFNHMEGGYVDGTQSSYVLGVGQTQDLEVGEFVYPLVKKYQSSSWVGADGTSIPVTSPMIEWYQTGITYQDTLVGTGVRFTASIPGTYYALINGVKQLGNIQIIAEVLPYTLSFDLNGGTGAVPPTQTVLEGELALAPTNPTREGYTFKGWNTSMDGTGINWDFTTMTMPANDITLYAQWEVNTYEVVFELNEVSRSIWSSQQVVFGELLVEPAAPTLDGYYFLEWNTQADGQGVSWDFNTMTMPANNVTLYAQWGQDSPGPVTEFMLTFNLNGGTGVTPPSQSLLEGDKAVKPVDPIKEGFTFAGWNTMANGTGMNWDFETMLMPANDVTLYAQWAQDSAKAPAPTPTPTPTPVEPEKTLPDTGMNGTTNTIAMLLIAVGMVVVLKKGTTKKY